MDKAEKFVSATIIVVIALFATSSILSALAKNTETAVLEGFLTAIWLSVFFAWRWVFRRHKTAK